MADAVYEWLPHAICLNHDPLIIIIMTLMDMLIGASYIVISTMLVVGYLRNRANFTIRSILVPMFACFIFPCGITHFTGAFTIYSPIYGIDTTITCLTALFSVTTAVWLCLPDRWQEALIGHPERGQGA